MKDKLVFEKKDNLWVLSGKDEFSVKQNRISNLLSAMIRASVYEKKSNKIESLEKFGLLPLSDEKSTAVKIELYNDKAKEIVSVDVGKYDAELGRGALGAYVKVNDNFEVLLANVNFIDLSVDYNNWVYNDMWNLQFGRLVKLNGKPEVDKMVELMSVILNTKLQNTKIKNTGNSSFTLNLNHI